MKTHLCKDCHYFNQYYIKGYACFNKASYGFCRKLKTINTNLNPCEYWKDNAELREVIKNRSLTTLEKAAESIIQIAQILNEEKEDNTPI